MRAKSDFLIGIEAHAYLAVLHFGVLLQPCHGSQYLGYAGLVVGTT